jgi:hypothetical protein
VPYGPSDGPHVLPDLYPGATAVYRTHGAGADSKHRTWYIFDDALALPEYMVEYEYLLERDSVLQDAAPHQGSMRGMWGWAAYAGALQGTWYSG